MQFPAMLLLYLDPTSGSMAFQIAIGGIVSVAATLRIYRAAVVRLFRRVLGQGERTRSEGQL